VSVYAVFIVNAPVLRVPLAPKLPLQPPDAVHAVALVELQLNTAAAPGATVAGLVVSTTPGTTFTVALAVARVPPAPVHVNE
jgi:hypothetical protein